MRGKKRSIMAVSSLRFKLLASTVIACTLIVMVVSIVQLLQLRSAEKTRIREEFANFERSAKQTISEAVWRYDWDMVETIVENQTSKVQSFVEICDDEVARCLQHGRRDYAPYLEYRIPMLYDDAVNREEVEIGSIYLQAHYSTLAEHIRSGLPERVLTNSLSVFGIALVLFYLFHRQVVQRLLALENATRRIDLKHIDVLDLPTRKEVGARRDEIDLLADAMDNLIVKVGDELERRRHLEQQLNHAQKMEALGTLAGGIAHDFNNILAAILGFAELSKGKTEEGSEIHRNLEKIINAGQRARNLISQILVFSRRTKAPQEVLNFAAVVEETLQLVRVALPSHIDLKTDLDRELHVKGDANGLHQVIMNVSTNGVQALSERGGTLTVTLASLVLEEKEAASLSVRAGCYACLAISDDGPGISEENQVRIFEPFFTTKQAGKGTGMGLAVVHGIIRSHGGTITLESRLEEGSCFRVFLPLTDRQLAAVADAAEVPKGSGERIVIVDDEGHVLDVGCAMLEELGYRVRFFADPREALEYLEGEKEVDLVITDLTMPKMSGVELAHELKNRTPNLPILLWTGHRDDMASTGLNRKLIDGILQKPFDVESLAQVVSRLIRRRPAETAD